jgi:hypothetical protein
MIQIPGNIIHEIQEPVNDRVRLWLLKYKLGLIILSKGLTGNVKIINKDLLAISTV